MRRSARSQGVADLPIGARGGLRHHWGYGERVLPILIDRGAPILPAQPGWSEAKSGRGLLACFGESGGIEAS